MNAVDSNVLIYAVDADEVDKSHKARSLLGKLSVGPIPFVLPWQCAVEFLACMRRWEAAGRLVRSETRGYLERYVLTFPLALPSQGILVRSLELSERHSLSYWDS